MKLIIAARALFIVILIVVTWLILTPDVRETEPGMDIARWIARTLFGDADLGDKVAHFLAFASLGAAAALGRLKIAQSGALMVAALAAYGGALEIGQMLGGVRDAELADALADAAGAGAGYPAIVFALGFAAARVRQ